MIPASGKTRICAGKIPPARAPFADAQGELSGFTAADNPIHGCNPGLTMTTEAFAGMDDLIMRGEIR